jgi:hypothetical protein
MQTYHELIRGCTVSIAVQTYGKCLLPLAAAVSAYVALTPCMQRVVATQQSLLYASST